MKISPAQVETARIALPQASTEAARPNEAAETRATPEHGDRVDLARGQSPAERVEHFATKVMDRITMLAEKQGLDLSAVQEAFAENIGRIQDGLAEGSIGGAEVGKALANTLDLLRDDLRAAIRTDDGSSLVEGGREGGGTEVGEPDVDPGTNLRDEARVDDGTNLRDEARVFPAPILGDEARVGDGTNLGDETRVGDGTNLGDEARVDDGTNLRDEARVYPAPILGDEARVGDGTNLGDEPRVGDGTNLGDEPRVGDGTNLGDEARVYPAPILGDEARVDDGVALAPPSDSAARVEAYASTVVERMQALLAESEGPVAEGLIGALEQFGANVDRILAGLSEGTMSAEQVGQALQNTLMYASEDVSRALALGGNGADDSDGTRLAPRTDEPGTDFGGRVADGDAVAPAEARFDELTAQIMERLGGLDASGLTREGQAALAELTEEFGSATERLDQAFFEDGSIAQDQFLDLFAAAYTELQEELGGLFGTEGAAVQLYDPTTGAEDLSAYPVSRLDATA